MHHWLINTLSASLLIWGLAQPASAQAEAAWPEYFLQQETAQQAVEALLSLEQGQRLLVLQAGQLHLYDLQQQQKLRSVPLARQGELVSVSRNAAGEIWVVLAERQVLHYRADLTLIGAYSLAGKGAISEAWALNQMLLFLDDGGLQRFDPASQRVSALKIPELAANPRLAVVSDQQLVVSLREDRLALVDAAQNKVLHQLDGHPWLVSLHASPDGQSLVTFGEDYRMRVWDLGTGQLSQEKEVDSFLTQAVFVDPQTLLAADIDSRLHLIALPEAGTVHITRFDYAFSGWPRALTAVGQTVLLPLNEADENTGHFVKVFSVPALVQQAETKGLFEAIENGDLARISEALQKDPSVLQRRSAEGQTLLAAAIEARQDALALALIAAGAELLKVDGAGRTALDLAISSLRQNPDNPVIDALLAKQALGSPTQQQNYLSEALRFDRKTFLKLLALGLDPNQRNEAEDTPLMVALQYGQLEMVEALLQKGARLDLTPPDQYSWLMYASFTPEGLAWFLKQGLPYDLKATNIAGNTALHIAAGNGALANCRTLLALGAELEAQNDAGNTPLLEAFERSLHEAGGQGLALLQFLLLQGASLTHHNHAQEGVTHLATQHHSDRLVAFLKDLPLDWNRPDGQGKSPVLLLLENATGQAPEAVLTALATLLKLESLRFEAPDVLSAYFAFVDELDDAEVPALQTQLLQVFTGLLSKGLDPYATDSAGHNALAQIAQLEAEEGLSPWLAQQLRRAIREISPR